MDFFMNKETEKLRHLLDFYDAQRINQPYKPPIYNELLENDFSFDILLFKIMMDSKLSENPYKLSYG